MKIIKLKRRKIRKIYPVNITLETKVDDEDFEMLSKFNWIFDGSYAVTFFYDSKNIRKKVYLHRFLLNPSKEKNVDHKNQDKLDNQRNNLRVCELWQNRANQPKQSSVKNSNCRSKFKGVKKQTLANSWTARIHRHNKEIYLGSFRTEQEAALAYNNAAKELFGEFAYLNLCK